MKSSSYAVAVTVAALLRSTPVVAQARTTAHDFGLESTSGPTRWLHSFAGRVVIVVYEDRDAAPQNELLKAELAARARATNLSADVTLLPVANLEGYGWWPARGFARDAVVQLARTQGHEILLDWSGQLRRAYGMAPRVSHVLVVGRAGDVVFRSAGALDAVGRARFFRALEASIAAPAP